jgi:alpha-methylacyl-CoA racemase
VGLDRAFDTLASVSRLPLEDVRVLDLTRLLPGPLCTVTLGDLGADVVKVEEPGTGDYARTRGPFRPAADPQVASASFIGLNRNKRSVVLDLKSAEGRAAALSLSERFDVVVESFRPGVLDRLGLSYEALAAVNPRIVVCSMNGWGSAGSMAQLPGHDLNYCGMLGILAPSGDLEDEPLIPTGQWADTAGGLYAAVGILAALHERDRSGRGQHIEVVLGHAALWSMAMPLAGALAAGSAPSRRDGLWTGGVVCYQTYRCADGWLALGALEEKFWRTLCEGLGRPDLAEHRYDKVDTPTHEALSAIFAARSRSEWAEFATTHNCCLTVLQGVNDALSSDLAREMGLLVEVSQPSIDQPFETLAHPVRFSRTPADEGRLPAPGLGEHTEVVLGGLTAKSAPV